MPGRDAAELTATVLVDRYWWRLTEPAAAEEAVAALDRTTAYAAYLRAQLAYTRVLFDDAPRADDHRVLDEGFGTAAGDQALRGWGLFWLGVAADNVHPDPGEAVRRYRQAEALCRDDPLLESYVVRHLAAHPNHGEAERLQRRSLHLRAAVGARPQVAAAQAALADALPHGPERDTLLETARATADELGLTWLRTLVLANL